MDERMKQYQDMDIIFMCISKEILVKLCDLFPQTAEVIKKRSLERRYRLMKRRDTNSKRSLDLQ